MSLCFFVSDLHGHIDRYQKLFAAIIQEKPTEVFFGGDLLPSKPIYFGGKQKPKKYFIKDYLTPKFQNLKAQLEENYPRVFLILGNDDGRGEEDKFFEGMLKGLWEYIHSSQVHFDQFTVYGYAYVPPTPFMVKDWERYDVSRFVDPGCIAPNDGWFSYNPREDEINFSTIQEDLQQLVRDDDLSRAIFLFHSPPYQTSLDRAGLDGEMIDRAPVDVHVGSIAIKRFIEKRQPLLTLHGHIHESTRITGSWKDQIGKTHCFSAAHDGIELALIRFDPNNLENATRDLL